MPDASLYRIGQRQRRMSINASYNTYTTACTCKYVRFLCTRTRTYASVRVWVYVGVVRASGARVGVWGECVGGCCPSVHACLLGVLIYSDFRQCETHNRI